MNKTKTIKIEKISDAIELVKQATEVYEDITLKRGKYSADCKSILGVMAINITEGAVIEYPKEAEQFEKYIQRFEI